MVDPRLAQRDSRSKGNNPKAVFYRRTTAVEHSNTTRFPVDYDAIHKGDVIPRSEIAKLLGIPFRNYHDLQIAVVGLQHEIADGLRARGKPYTVCQKNGDLAILDDPNASEYNQEWFHKHRRGLFRCHARLAAVDSSQLTEDQRRKHVRDCPHQARLRYVSMYSDTMG
jgi:hypothetical protein